MLQMYYLPTHVFSKKEKYFEETAMALACDTDKLLTASTTTPRAVLPILLSIKRNKCRLLPAVARKNELQSKLWSRKRRRRIAAVEHHRRPDQLLFKLQLHQHKRPAGAYRPPAVLRARGSAQERHPAGDALPGDRQPRGRRFRQSAPPSLRSKGLCSRSAPSDSGRGAACDCVSPVALARPLRPQRNQAHPQMSEQPRSRLRLLQSRALESTVSTR